MHVNVLVMLGAGIIQCVIQTERCLEEGRDVSKMKSMCACVWLSSANAVSSARQMFYHCGASLSKQQVRFGLL